MNKLYSRTTAAGRLLAFLLMFSLIAGTFGPAVFAQDAGSSGDTSSSSNDTSTSGDTGDTGNSDDSDDTGDASDTGNTDESGDTSDTDPVVPPADPDPVPDDSEGDTAALQQSVDLEFFNNQTGTLIVRKVVINDNGGTKTADDFSFTVDKQGIGGVSNHTFEADGENSITVNTGAYDVEEDNDSGYTTTYSSDRPGNNANHCENIAIGSGQTVICTITNNDKAPSLGNGATLTINKIVTNNNGGTADADDFSFTVTKTPIIGPSQSLTLQFEADGSNSLSVDKFASYSVTENPPAGYSASFSSGCSGFLVSSRSCTVTNDDQAPSLTLVKQVAGDGQLAPASSWTLSASGPTNISGAGGAVSDGSFMAGSYTLAETGSVPGYSAGSWSCTNDVTVGQDNAITLAVGQSTTCSITNTYSPTPQMCTLVSDDEDTYVGMLPATEVTAHPNWTQAYSADGAAWIWDASDVDGTVTFTRTFTSSNAGTATVNVAADNSYSVKVNGNTLSCDGSGDSNFGSPETCTAPVVSGSNTLEFTVTNTGGVANPGAGNPAGLYYKVTIPNSSCADVPPAQTSDVMLCKVDTEGNGLANWQLYLKGANVENDLSVPANSSAGVDSVSLASGVQYLLTAMGTWDNNRSPLNRVDAEYSSDDNWATQMNGYTGYGDGILELEVDETDTDWGPYTSTHTYSQLFTGTGSSANFRIFDGDTNTHTQNEGWFGDNTGNLLVDIDEVYAGTTNQNGCVTLEDVPYGTYTIGEIAQSNWVLDSIKDGVTSIVGSSVTVDEPLETFTLVNEDVSEEPAACVLVSDTTTFEGGSASFLASFIHSSWTAVVDGASWIWGDPAIVDPVGTETQTFTKSFSLDAVPSVDATLEIAADNTYSVTVNGNPIATDANEDNYTSSGQDTITIPASALQAGVNTLEIEVTNKPMPNGTTETNPAGLKYRLTINGTDCEVVTPEPTTLKVHIFKYLQAGEGEAQVANDSGETAFPMSATWSAANIGSGTGAYVLGNSHGGAPYQYAADTSAMSAPADYTTSENTDGSVVVPIGGECSPGKYRLVGYRQGTSLEAAEDAPLTETAPVYTGITSDRYVIVVNEDCDEDTGPTEPDTETIVVTDDTSAGENLLGWMFGRDTSTETPFEFALGNASIGLGSLFVPAITNTVDGNSDKFIAELFLQKQIADINSISYDFKIAAPDANVEEHFYMSVYANFGVSPATKFYDCRYAVVPTTGSMAGFTTVTFDPSLTYSVTQSGSSPAACPASPAAMGAGAHIRAISLNVGDTSGSDTGVSGYLDRVVVNTDTLITTYDFEPAPAQPETPTEEDDDEGSSPSRHSNASGSVLGAFTDGSVLGNTCPLLTDYMRQGMANNPSQVTLLQNFLNTEMTSGLSVNGSFDTATTQAVNSFQLKYWQEVLKPWADIGIGQEQTPTGYVFKTTLWKVNDIACPDLDIPFPTLP